MSVIQTPSEGLFLPGPPPDRLNPLAQGLIGTWPMDEGAGSVVHDLSGGHSHGVIHGGITSAVDTMGPCLRFDGTNDL